MPPGKITRFFKCESLHCVENPSWKNADHQVNSNTSPEPYLMAFRRKHKHVLVVKLKQSHIELYVQGDFMETSDAKVIHEL